MDVTADPALCIGILTSLPEARKVIREHPVDEPISEFTIDDDVKLEIWKVNFKYGKLKRIY